MTYELPDEVRTSAMLAGKDAFLDNRDRSRDFHALSWPDKLASTTVIHAPWTDVLDAVTPILAAHFERSGAERVVELEGALRKIAGIVQSTDRFPSLFQMRIHNELAAVLNALPLPSQATNTTEEV